MLFVKLQNYFFKVLLPEVVTCKNDICADNKQKYYCICRRPCFEPMIACDAKPCDIEWYHYACANIKIALKGSWFCENCTAKNKKEIEKLNESTFFFYQIIQFTLCKQTKSMQYRN